MAEPWYVRAFGAAYSAVYAHRDDAAAAAEAAFAARVLGAPGARLLDAACGGGRHARALCAAGAHVVGLDLSADLLRAARAAAGGPHYVRGDLRALPFARAAFDGVASFFTSFGYFDDAGNARQLREFRRVLRPAGRLLLDYLNAAHVAATLVPRSERQVAGARIVEERAIRGGRVEKRVRIEPEVGRPRTWTESVRLYDGAALCGVVQEAGFVVRDVRGDLGGGELAAASPRCVVVAEAA